MIQIADELIMGSLLLFFCALAAFFVSSRGLIKALTENTRILSYIQGYSRKALRVAKFYKVTAWLLLTLFLFVTTVDAFLVVFKTF